MAKVYATPGVYIEEKSAFPNSAVPVATAVPAFIGYTEQAIRNQKTLTNVPTRISSFGEYLLYFGGAPSTTYGVTAQKLNYKIAPQNKRYLLFNSIRMFFANGGSDCYIISIGDYNSSPTPGDFFGEEVVDGEKQLIGINTLWKEPEPTMLVIPDAVLLSEADCFTVQQQMIKHCGLMRNRISILDVYDGFKKRSNDQDDIIEKFRSGVGNNFLDFASAYYPWLNATVVGPLEIDFLNIDQESRSAFMELLRLDNAQSVKEGVLDQARANLINAEIGLIPKAALHAEISELFDGFGQLVNDLEKFPQNGITDAANAMDGIDAASETVEDDINDVLGRTDLGRMLGGIPIGTLDGISSFEGFDVNGTVTDPDLSSKDQAAATIPPLADALMELAIELEDGELYGVSDKVKSIASNLQAAASGISKLKGAVDGGNVQAVTTEQIAQEFQKMTNEAAANLNDTRARLAQMQAAFTNDNAVTQLKALGQLIQLPKDDPANTKSAIEALNPETLRTQLSAGVGKVMEERTDVNTLHQTLLTISPLYREVMNNVRSQSNLLPPSGCMAGIFSMVDSNAGVWQSPANVSVSSVVGPAVSLTNEEQEDLNVPLSGKAINAIRTFPGKGVLVWGARTLDGNSQDWRYISVRRTVIFIEQSIKYAAEAYVFEPNVASTWTNLKALISNFLTNVWQQGALAGATADDAFSVDVGLGTTMTPVDIQDGIMRITVKIAVTRPAEFIVITFQQQMQKS